MLGVEEHERLVQRLRVLVGRRWRRALVRDELDDHHDEADEDLAVEDDAAEVDVLLLLLACLVARAGEEPALLRLIQLPHQRRPVQVPAPVVVRRRVGVGDLQRPAPRVPPKHPAASLPSPPPSPGSAAAAGGPPPLSRDGALGSGHPEGAWGPTREKETGRRRPQDPDGGRGEKRVQWKKERRSAEDKAPVGPAHMDGKQSTGGGDMLRSIVNSASRFKRLLVAGLVAGDAGHQRSRVRERMATLHGAQVVGVSQLRKRTSASVAETANSTTRGMITYRCLHSL